MTKMTPQKFSTAVLVLGVAVLLWGASSYWGNDAKSTNIGSKTSIMERDSALLRAKQGDGQYSFSTSFIPGLGYTGSADQIRQEFMKSNEGAVTN